MKRMIVLCVLLFAGLAAAEELAAGAKAPGLTVSSPSDEHTRSAEWRSTPSTE